MLPRVGLRLRPPRPRQFPFASQPCLLAIQCRNFQPVSISSNLPHRSFSLSALFPFKQPPSPSPFVVAHITRLEAEANVHPHNVEKQLALFQALVDTKLTPSYNLLIERWERMCEFDPSSPLLRSPEAFELYLKCLVNTGKKDSVNAAVRRRDSLLAKSATAAASSATGASETVASEKPATAEPTADSSSAEPVTEPATKPSSPNSDSHTIAQSVLSGSPTLAASSSGSSRIPLSPLSPDGDSGSPIQVSIVERKGAWIPKLIRFALGLAVASFFFLVILSVFFENSGFMKAGPRQAQFEQTDGKSVKFSDLHGVDEAKDELQDVVLFLKDPASFATLGGKLPKGVLLTGPPGTGKTMLARAVAGEAGVPFFFASGSDFEEMFVGVGAKRVRELFAAARKKQPAIIFIDELDAVGGKRGTRDQQYMKQTLNQLLVEMDGFQQSEGVIVIAATNFPESLDPALTRPGRFDRHIAVPLPDVRGRVHILQHHMKGVQIDPNVDAKILARGTPGFSGADLQNMVNQAAVQASKERAKFVTLKHFEWAKDRILMGAERKSSYIDNKAKLATAYHEGGHALVALYTDGAMPLHKVTCVPRGHALGVTTQLPEDDRHSISFKEYLATIDVCMGGRVAEELIYGTENVTSGASSDIQKATNTALAMVKYWGFSRLGPIYFDEKNREISPRRKEEIEDEVSKIVKAGEARATAILTERVEELHRLAHALIEHETLDAEEVRKVIKGQELPAISLVLEEDLAKEKEKVGQES